MRIPRPTVAAGAAVLVVVVLGAGVVFRIRGGAEDPATGGVASSPGAMPVAGAFDAGVLTPVEGAPIVRDTLVLAVKAAGQAAPLRAATLRAQVRGRVLAVDVAESRRVGQGALLIRIDPEEYDLAVQQAEADLRSAQAEYQSMTLRSDLIDDPAVREERERVARAKSGLERAEVALARARLDLARTRVTAPFAGRVADLAVVPGQRVSAGDELLTVASLEPMRVEVQVLETEVPHLSPGGRAQVTFAAFPDAPIEGRIRSINPVVDGETRTARVTVRVPNPGGRILPGMYAQVSLDARRFPDRILAPRSAILERDRRTMLFVYEGDERGGLAKWVYVKTGLENDSVVELLPDEEYPPPEPGSIVLTDGHYTLIHDARVRLVESVRAAGGRPD